MDRVFIDMDGVLADFERMMKESNLSGDQLKRTPAAFAMMEPMPGAIGAVASLTAMGYHVWIATKCPTGIPFAYMDKATWVLKHLPQLQRNLIMTHDKGMLGGRGDYLIDDRPHKANCEAFEGTLIPFINTDWAKVMAYLAPRSPQAKRIADLTPPPSLYLAVTTNQDDPNLAILRPDGQQKAYLVLSEEERAKGYMRPVRNKYQHVGKRPVYPLIPLTPEQAELYSDENYTGFEKYPEQMLPRKGKFWTQIELDGGCNVVTTMGPSIAETHARNPKFYSATYCAGCERHFNIDQFVWDGTNEKMGS